ncbi:DNA mismatch repair protein MutT [Mucor ambiguus]|uniref:DNA mismatch repair protein MutT n=1 Tax=Mucor ambiguus TaxID=91626 RepID=A0A0C9LVE2_9FUNG|nr:DNA mismatch repair protein MutT [Mucor ambiguus]
MASIRSLSSRIARFALYECTADLSHLSTQEHAALKHLVKAGKYIDQLYMRQAWAGNEELRKKLHAEGNKELITLFEMYKGPWAREDDNVPFVDGAPERPEGGNFYPEGMKKADFEAWVETLSPEEQKRAKSYYTLIRKDDHGRFETISYAKAYADLLKPAAEHLREAANELKGVKLADEEQGTRIDEFLASRADAFETNNYLDSELDWLRLGKSNKLEITIGPYEQYTDGLFTFKSAYEFYIHVRDEHSSKLLEKFSDLQFVEDRLPIPEKYRNDKLVAAPIVVVNQLYAAGDVAVPMTAAYNLPNDEEAIKKGGSKLVLIKNVQEGKFEHVLTPIASQVLAKDQLAHLTKDAFTTHVLLHEVCHSNGPHHTLKGDTVRSKLQEYHSALEEAKADIAALFAADLMVDHGTIDNVTQKEFWVTFLASAFRSIRFGIQEAHGLGQAIQLNYLVEKGGFKCDEKTKLFSVDFEKIRSAVSDLTRDILILQGDGDKTAVDDFVKKYGILHKDTKDALARIDDAGIPVDIRPHYPLAN